MTCPRCGSPADPGSQYCTGCGSPLRLAYVAGGEGAPCAVHAELRAVAACNRCGSFACPDCLVATRAGGELCRVCHARAPEDLLPWDRRREIGTWKAYFRTSVLLLKRPRATFASARPDGTVAESLIFIALANLTGTSSTALLYAGLLGFMTLLGAGNGDPSPALALAMVAGILLFFLVLIPLTAVGSAILLSGLDHLVLRAIGARPREWRVTLRAAALAHAPLLVGLVPICGAYIHPIWVLVLKVLAYQAFHGTTAGKAAAGALLLPGLFVLAIVAYLALL